MVRNIFSIAFGLFASLLTIIIFQLQSPHVFPPLEEHNPEAFWELTEEYRPIQIRDEIIGITLGIFIGAFLSAFLLKTRSKKITLLFPLLFVLVITTKLCPLTLPKELIWLALPLLVIIASSAYYLTLLIRKK